MGWVVDLLREEAEGLHEDPHKKRAYTSAIERDERLAVARALLHAATCHYYAAVSVAEARELGGGDDCGGGAADPSPAGGGGGGGWAAVHWPYDEPCCEPLFAALSPAHQWWLISDVLAALWAPAAGDGSSDGDGGDTPLHGAALLALAQLAGIHAAAEAGGAPPPALLLEARVARSCAWLPRSEHLFASLKPGRSRPPGRLCDGRWSLASEKEKAKGPDWEMREWLTLRCGMLLVKRGVEQRHLERSLESLRRLHRHGLLAAPAAGHLAGAFGLPLLEPLWRVLQSAWAAAGADGGSGCGGAAAPPQTLAQLGALLAGALEGCGGGGEHGGGDGDGDDGSPWGNSSSSDGEEGASSGGASAMGQQQQEGRAGAEAVGRLETTLEVLTGGLLAQLRRDARAASAPQDRMAAALHALQQSQLALLARLPQLLAAGGGSASSGGGGGGGSRAVAAALAAALEEWLRALWGARAALLSEAASGRLAAALQPAPRRAGGDSIVCGGGGRSGGSGRCWGSGSGGRGADDSWQCGGAGGGVSSEGEQEGGEGGAGEGRGEGARWADMDIVVASSSSGSGSSGDSSSTGGAGASIADPRIPGALLALRRRALDALASEAPGPLAWLGRGGGPTGAAQQADDPAFLGRVALAGAAAPALWLCYWCAPPGGGGAVRAGPLRRALKEWRAATGGGEGSGGGGEADEEEEGGEAPPQPGLRPLDEVSVVARAVFEAAAAGVAPGAPGGGGGGAAAGGCVGGGAAQGGEAKAWSLDDYMSAAACDVEAAARFVRARCTRFGDSLCGLQLMQKEQAAPSTTAQRQQQPAAHRQRAALPLLEPEGTGAAAPLPGAAKAWCRGAAGSALAAARALGLERDLTPAAADALAALADCRVPAAAGGAAAAEACAGSSNGSAGGGGGSVEGWPSYGGPCNPARSEDVAAYVAAAVGLLARELAGSRGPSWARALCRRARLFADAARGAAAGGDEGGAGAWRPLERAAGALAAALEGATAWQVAGEACAPPLRALGAAAAELYAVTLRRLMALMRPRGAVTEPTEVAAALGAAAASAPFRVALARAALCSLRDGGDDDRLLPPGWTADDVVGCLEGATAARGDARPGGPPRPPAELAAAAAAGPRALAAAPGASDAVAASLGQDGGAAAAAGPTEDLGELLGAWAAAEAAAARARAAGATPPPPRRGAWPAPARGSLAGGGGGGGGGGSADVLLSFRRPRRVGHLADDGEGAGKREPDAARGARRAAAALSDLEGEERAESAAGLAPPSALRLRVLGGGGGVGGDEFEEALGFEARAAALLAAAAASVETTIRNLSKQAEMGCLSHTIATECTLVLGGQRLFDKERFAAAEAAAWGGAPGKGRILLRGALQAVSPHTPAMLQAQLLQGVPLTHPESAFECVGFQPGAAEPLRRFFKAAGGELARHALVLPPAWRGLLGGTAAAGTGGGGERGAAAGCMRRQYARATSRSMAAAAPPEALARQLLRFQALRAAAVTLAEPGAEPGAPDTTGDAAWALDCLSELAAPGVGAGAPPHLLDGAAAWRAARQLGLEGAWEAHPAGMACVFAGELEGCLARGLESAGPMCRRAAARMEQLKGDAQGLARAAAAQPPRWLDAQLGARERLAAALAAAEPRLRAAGLPEAAVRRLVRAASGGLAAACAAMAQLPWRAAMALVPAVRPLAALGAAAGRPAGLLLQAGVVVGAAGQGAWCGLAAEYHARLAGARAAAAAGAAAPSGGGDDSRGAPPADAFIAAADGAADALGGAALLEAAPWMHARHLVGGAPAAAAAAEREAEVLCDWCGGEAPKDSGGSGSLGCGACGCARYCGRGCAAAAARLHARNCWRLQLLAAPGAALRAGGDPGRPMFAFEG
ncbi:MAG: hypothetical protein J3K34DRAFT_483528 [Monoraphidium minutum]|nr:MAG: hypothetical protein J3K34DRAFT_483528 [Monoraphidium minutum]